MLMINICTICALTAPITEAVLLNVTKVILIRLIQPPLKLVGLFPLDVD